MTANNFRFFYSIHAPGFLLKKLKHNDSRSYPKEESHISHIYNYHYSRIMCDLPNVMYQSE